jgi:hypothetical protein
LYRKAVVGKSTKKFDVKCNFLREKDLPAEPQVRVEKLQAYRNENLAQLPQ